MKAVRVFLIEDEPSVLRLLRRILEGDERTVVAGEAATAEEALQSKEIGSADVVTMDVVLPGMNGVEATRRLKALYPHLKIIMVSSHGGDLLEESIEAGADGYVLKLYMSGSLVNRLAEAAKG